MGSLIQHEHILYQILDQMQNQRLEEAKKTRLYFSMRKSVRYGEALWVTGDIEALGNWRIEKSLRLAWSEGDLWTGSLLLPSSCLRNPIEYKYFTAGFSNPWEGKIEWEIGNKNRRLQGLEASLEAPASLFLENQWNLKKITVLLIDKGQKRNRLNQQQIPALQKAYQDESKILVAGGARELGSWKRRIQMTRLSVEQQKPILVTSLHNQIASQLYSSSSQQAFRDQLKSILEGDWDIEIYQIQISVDLDLGEIEYFYLKQESDQLTAEPMPHRKYSFDSGNHQSPFPSLCRMKLGNLEIVDFCDFSIYLKQVTEKIAISSAVKKISDISKLTNKGIEAVISLREDREGCQKDNQTDQMFEMQFNQNGIQNYRVHLDSDHLSACLKQLKKVGFLIENLAYRENKSILLDCDIRSIKSSDLLAMFFVATKKYSLQQAILFLEAELTQKVDCELVRKMLRYC